MEGEPIGPAKAMSRHKLLPPVPEVQRGRPFKLDSTSDSIVYAHGRSVYSLDIRGLHRQCSASSIDLPVATTVARLSTDKGVLAIGTTTGLVYIFDYAERRVLRECRVLGGAIKDLAWSDTGIVIAVGEGRDHFVAAFNSRDGSSAGEFVGHARQVNCVAARGNYVVTGGDDGFVAIHRLERGKYTLHRSYSKCVKPVFDACAVDDAAFEVASGNKIVRLSVDGEVLEEKTLHKGSVTALADSVSVSTDGLALAGSQRFEQSGCQLLGAAKVGSLGFALVTDSGKIAILDSSLSHAASYDAHCKGISGIVSLGASLFTCSLLEGSVCRYDSELELVEKKRCGAQLIFKMDSKLHMICGSNVCDASGSILSTDPRFNGAAAHEGTRFIGADGVLYECGDGLTALQEGCACISGAVSADKAKQVYVNLKPVFQHSPGVPTCILSLANGCIAVGDDLRRVRVYGADGKVLANWAYHNARVVLLAQHKDLLFSAGLDNDIYGWRIGVDDPVVHLKNAHPSSITGMTSFGDLLVTCGQDGTIRSFAFCS